MRLALGAVTCLGAVIVAPKMLIAEGKKKQIPVLSEGYYFDRNGNYITSGYVRIDHGKDSVVPQTWTITATTSEETTEWVTVKS